MLTMTRRVTFSAAQADWVFGWSEAENRRVFGEKAAPIPHGHNYVLDVQVRGEIDLRTGIIVNIKDIDALVREHIVRVLGNTYINQEVAAFRERPVTAENLVAFILAALEGNLPSGVRLTGLRLEETPLDVVTWQAEEPAGEPMMMQMTRVYEFAASHRLHSPHLTEAENQALFGKCNYVHGHGHNYILEVTVSGPVDPCTGRVWDGAELDVVVNREVVERYDHRHLNYDIPEFQTSIPSSEVVTKTIFERLKPFIPGPARLERVVVRETARNFFEYSGEDNEVE